MKRHRGPLRYMDSKEGTYVSGARLEQATRGKYEQGGRRVLVISRTRHPEPSLSLIYCVDRFQFCKDFENVEVTVGSRGPLRNPNSVRGERERRNGGQEPLAAAGSTPSQPDWLPKAARPFWQRIRADLEVAGVVLEAVDADAVGLYALSVFEAQRAARLADKATTDRDRLAYLGRVTRFSRDAMAWSTLIGATPGARARMHIKPKPTADPDDPWARFGRE